MVIEISSKINTKVYKVFTKNNNSTNIFILATEKTYSQLKVIGALL